ESKGRIAVDTISRDLRRARNLDGFTASSLVLTDFDGATNLAYNYDHEARTLVRTKGTESRTLLSECDSFTFDIYQRTPVAGTFDQVPAVDETTCKVIQINWACSRTILGGRVTSESAQSAKVVMRNK